MDQSNTEQLTEELKKVEVGYLPEPLFISLARLVSLTAIEFLPFRKNNDGTIEILLIERPTADPIWPGMLHTPGTIIRSTDTSINDAFQCLYNDELMTSDPIEPVFAGVEIIPYKRGSAVGIEYFIDYKGEPRNGKFYDVTNLPDTLIPEQIPMIEHVLERYKNT